MPTPIFRNFPPIAGLVKADGGEFLGRARRAAGGGDGDLAVLTTAKSCTCGDWLENQYWP